MRVFLPLILAIVAISTYTYTRDSTFISAENIQNVLSQAAPLGILALGQTVLLIGAQLDLSVGSAASFCGAIAARLVIGPSTSEWVVVLVVVAVGGAIGLFWGVLVAYVRVPAFILTLGGLSVLSSAALVLTNSTPIPIGSAFSVLAVGSWLGVQTPIVICAFLAIIVSLGLRYTRFGRNVFAVGSNEQAAYLSGVPTRSVKIMMFALNGVLVAPAALILMAHLGSGDPTMGSGLELQAVAAGVLGGASLLGGRGSVVGTVLAVVLFGVIASSLVFLNISGNYEDMVYGGVLIVAVTLAALGDRQTGEGIFGVLRRGWSSLIHRPSDWTLQTGGTQAGASESSHPQVLSDASLSTGVDKDGKKDEPGEIVARSPLGGSNEQSGYE
ncbi:MAG: ABC transporter permease [Actinomycetota bacterium]|nr:ABC transporter permease [Actinomycetota bacterium]